MAILLTLAGRKRTSGALGTWAGGAVVQLDSTGTWSELVAGDTVAWRLKNFVYNTVHTLFHIRSSGHDGLNMPKRGQLYVSDDQGATWTDITPQTGGNTEYVADIAQDADGGVWCITDERESNSGVSGGPSRIYHSSDNGTNWTLKYTTVISFSDRYFQLYNITAHPTDANIIVAEGVDMFGWDSRLWRTTDGGDNWTRFTPTTPDPPDSMLNVGGLNQHVFAYTAAGFIIWAGIFELLADDRFILRSSDDGTSWVVVHTGSIIQDYGATFFESTLTYVTLRNTLFESGPPINPNQPVKIASDDDSPFNGDYNFHGFSRHEISGIDNLYLGTLDVAPGIGATDSPSVFTRPADLSSGWVELPAFANMDSDLGYRLYVDMDGLVGATVFEGEVPTPPKADEPPAGDPGAGEPGAGEPGVGEARVPRREPVVRRGLRGRRGFKAGPPGHRGLPPVQGEQIDKRIPDEYEEPLVRKWLTFGWLAIPMLEGQKTITLRDWGPTEGVQWQHGELFYAYDTPPVEGGRRLAILRVMQEPFVEFTARLRMSDYHKLGFSYAMANRLMAPSGRTALQVWEDLHNNPESLWLLRFAVERIFEQGRKEQDTVQIAERPPQ